MPLAGFQFCIAFVVAKMATRRAAKLTPEVMTDINL